jgi:hypothetical protein
MTTPRAGALTVLYSFCAHVSNNVCTDCENSGPLVLSTDGNFYGTTYWGGHHLMRAGPRLRHRFQSHNQRASISAFMVASVDATVRKQARRGGLRFTG